MKHDPSFAIFAPQKVVYVILARSYGDMMRHLAAWTRAKESGAAYNENPHDAPFKRARLRYRRHLRAAITHLRIPE